MKKDLIAGIDIGTVTIAVVLLDNKGVITHRDYRFHKGNVYAKLQEMVRKFPAQSLTIVGVAAEKGREFFKTGFEINEQVAVIELFFNCLQRKTAASVG